MLSVIQAGKNLFRKKGKNMLENKIRAQKQQKDILLMTHLVLGYPSFDENYLMIQEMHKAGVELVELQIPFSEPTADGPVLLKANQESLKKGTKLKECFEFAQKVSKEFQDISFLFMTYYNILYTYGVSAFVEKSKELGIQGFIIPDLPPEEGGEYIEACKINDLDSIFIFTPTSTPERLKLVDQHSTGLIYSVGRKGVTGAKTSFDAEVAEQIERYKAAANIPLALGFGVSSKEDVRFLKEHGVDIAVIGSKLLRIQEEEGSAQVGDFLLGIR
jgi:tryptophan synthase alpha chain